MGQPSDPDPQTIPIRVYSEPDGKVYLLYEAADQRAEVQSPIDQTNIEAAKQQLIEQTYTVLQAEIAKFEGKDLDDDTPQQKANRRIKQALLPPARPPFGRYVVELFGRLIQFLFAGLIVLCIITLVYKGVELSQRHLPEFFHWVVIALYVLGVALCVYLMATDEKRREQANRIRRWFGPAGMLILPSLTLMAAAAVFSSVTFTLYQHGMVAFQECSGRPVAEGTLTDFYMWLFIKLVPLVRVNEVLKLSEPLCYTQKRVGFLILLFQALVVIPSINTILYYWKNRRTLHAKPFKFVYEAGWTPESNSESKLN
jgi:hypothetical protein